ncbi:MAG: hypothetical protein ACOY3I_04665 [Verrucomicrobiota bacterium]
MTTYAPTEVRKNLSSFLKRSMKGEDIGIVYAGKIIALRPIQVISQDYAFQEYGMTSKEMGTFVKKLDWKLKREHKKGKLKKYTGNFEADLRD